jgi:hypothetical protein
MCYHRRPSVEKANKFAPQHSRIFREVISIHPFHVNVLLTITLQMIQFTTPVKPFTYTGKETPRRRAIIREYEPEIDELYAAMDDTSNVKSSVSLPKEWDISSTLTFVRAVVHEVMVNKAGDHDDLFEYGCDR